MWGTYNDSQKGKWVNMAKNARTEYEQALERGSGAKSKRSEDEDREEGGS